MLVFCGTFADTTAPTWEKRHAQRDQRFFYYHRQSWRRAGPFGAVDAELCFSKRRRAMSSVGQTTIPDPGRTWCYRRCGSAHPNRGSDIASGLGLRSFLSTTFLACTIPSPGPAPGLFLALGLSLAWDFLSAAGGMIARLASACAKRPAPIAKRFAAHPVWLPKTSNSCKSMV